MAPSPHSLKIRLLNDDMRARLPETEPANKVLITRGVQALNFPGSWALLLKVKAFDGFTPDNDPHGEHDFGSIDFRGERFFWKIDYYDRQMQMHSPDPADPAVTSRVLTIMRADEY